MLQMGGASPLSMGVASFKKRVCCVNGPVWVVRWVSGFAAPPLTALRGKVFAVFDPQTMSHLSYDWLLRLLHCTDCLAFHRWWNHQLAPEGRSEVLTAVDDALVLWWRGKSHLTTPTDAFTQVLLPTLLTCPRFNGFWVTLKDTEHTTLLGETAASLQSLRDRPLLPYSQALTCIVLETHHGVSTRYLCDDTLWRLKVPSLVRASIGYKPVVFVASSLFLVVQRALTELQARQLADGVCLNHFIASMYWLREDTNIVAPPYHGYRYKDPQAAGGRVAGGGAAGCPS